MSILGSVLTLERTLPTEVLTGVLSQQYSIHGGVIRNASGQIVRHLVSASSTTLDPFGFISAIPNLYNVYQIKRLAEMTQQVLAISTATVALSGLNLAVSALGFMMMRDSLKKVEQHLEKSDKKLAWIKVFLDSSRRARLLSAVDELATLPSATTHRQHILHSSREKLGEVAMHYLQHWSESNELQEVMAYQHYYCMAFLAKSRCSAELEMYDNAVSEFQNGLTQWQEGSRAIIRDKIFANSRSRFFSNEYLNLAPTAKIAGWMDFAYNDKRGYEWIDTLRQEYEPPSKGFIDNLFTAKKKDDAQADDVTYLDNLFSRNSILEGYGSQLKFLADNEVKPSLFQEEINSLVMSDDSDKVLILAPTEQALETS